MRTKSKLQHYLRLYILVGGLFLINVAGWGNVQETTSTDSSDVLEGDSALLIATNSAAYPQPIQEKTKLLTFTPSLAQTDAASPYRFRPLQQYVPALLIGLGTWGLLDNVWFRKQRETLNNALNGYEGWKRQRADDRLQYLPIVAYQGLAFIPQVKHRHNLRDRLLLNATATILVAGVVNLSKHTIYEMRPDASAHNSFPSGHTATAFMGAELVRLEYGNYFGAGAYAVAATVGGMRMYNKRHWLNDVLAGAGVGILSARAAHWLLPWQKRLLGWDKSAKKKDTTWLLMPSYHPTYRAPQMVMAITF